MLCRDCKKYNIDISHLNIGKERGNYYEKSKIKKTA